jgi:predicted metalloendopeptidase
VNGGWLDRTEIPSDKTSWGSFNELQENNQEILKSVAEESRGLEEGSDAWKAGLFYRVAMDSALAEAGQPALEKLLAIASSIEDRTSLQAAMSQLTPYNITGLFRSYVRQDARKNDINTLYLSQSGLSLPDRDYYLKKDAKTKEILTKYKAHLQQMFRLVGDDDDAAMKAAERVIAMETSLAEIFMPRTELRNPLKTYNKMAVSDLQERANALDWKAYFEAIGLGNVDTVIVRTRPYMEKLSKVLEKTGPSAWSDYMRYRAIKSLATYMGKDFEDAHFDFYSKTLNGTEEKKPRWKDALGTTDRMM